MKSTRVLIAEDEALVAMELKDRLAGLGYVITASVDTADAALRAAADSRPDIALMDIHLQGAEDGIDAAAALRERYDIPVVFLSAYTDEETLARAQTSGPYGFLAKPYREKDLYLAVEIALVKHQNEKELRQANESLEQKVRERTAELSRTVEKLQTEIAERKQAETSLRESEAKFRSLFDWAHDGILIVDAATRTIVEANIAMCAMLGYLRDEILGSCIDAIHPPQDMPRVLEEFRHVVENGKKPAINVPVMRKDGSVFYSDISHTTVFLDGRPHAMGIFRDISWRKRTEEILQARLRLTEYTATHSLDELLQKALDEVGALTDSPIGFYHFVEADQKTLTLQAWSTRTVQEFCRAEGKGLHYGIEQAGVWVDCVHQRKPVVHNDYAALPHRKGMPPGHAAVIRELVVPIFRDDKVVAILGVGNKPREYTRQDVELVAFLADVVWEVGGRKRAEEEIRAANDRLEFLLSSSPAVIYTCRYGGDWAATFMSENILEVLGYSAADHLRSPDFWFGRIHPDDRQRVIAGLRALDTADFYTHEYRFLHRDGTYRWMFDRLRVVRDEQGVPVECVGSWMDITDRKISEERLHLLHKAVSTSRAGITFRDANNMIVYTNAAEARMHGYKTDELIGRPARMLSPPELWRDMDNEEMGRIAGWERESVNVRKDGTIFPVHLASEIVKDENGHPLGIVTVCEDITERKRYENALAETNVLLEAVFDHTHVLTAYLDPQFYFIRVNWAYATADNREPSFYPGWNLFDLYPDEENKAIFQRVVESGEPHFVYAKAFTYAEHPERGVSYWDWSLVPIKTTDGDVLGLVLSQVNVTESVQMRTELETHRQRLEAVVAERTGELQDTIRRLNDEISERTKLTEELHRSKLFLTNILNSIQDGICVLDAKRNIMLVNSTVAKWVPDAEQIGFRTHTCGDLFHSLGRCDWCVADSSVPPGGVRTMYFPGREGLDNKWFEVHSYPLNAENGTVIGCVEYIRDVTEAKKMEERLAHYHEQLRTLNYEMAAMRNREQRRIAQELHDSIPQNLVFCRLRLESIERSWSKAAPIADQAAPFEEIYQLLDSSITEARSLIFKLAPPVLYELGLEPALQQLLNQFGRTHAIDFRYKGRGPGAPIKGEGAAIIYGMVRELLINCIKHSGADTVDVSVERKEGNLIISVRDNGRGIDQETVARRMQAEGVGFGLFSIRERLHHMEGEFVIRNGEGPGACATIRVPLSLLQLATTSPRQTSEDL